MQENRKKNNIGTAGKPKRFEPLRVHVTNSLRSSALGTGRHMNGEFQPISRIYW